MVALSGPGRNSGTAGSAAHVLARARVALVKDSSSAVHQAFVLICLWCWAMRAMPRMDLTIFREWCAHDVPHIADDRPASGPPVVGRAVEDQDGRTAPDDFTRGAGGCAERGRLQHLPAPFGRRLHRPPHQIGRA